MVEQHHSECTSISERTGCVMLIVVSIALGVYPQDPMKPFASELFSSLLLLKAKSMWALEEKDILCCMFQPINTVKECRNTVYYYLLCDCGDKKMFLCPNKMEGVWLKHRSSKWNGEHVLLKAAGEQQRAGELWRNSWLFLPLDHRCAWTMLCITHSWMNREWLYSAQKKKNPFDF